MNAEVIGELSRITRRKCISRLNQRLTELGITVHPTNGGSFSSPRGGAYFMRYLPAETSFELLPGFTKYFQVAQRYNLLNSYDAEILIRKLVTLGAHLRATYKGRLSHNLHSGLIGEFFDRVSDPEALRYLEDTESWFPDILHEQLRMPCVVDHYIIARDFMNLSLDLGTISQSMPNPMLAIVAGMDLVRLGPWLGLTTAKISAALDLFEEVSTKPQRADSSMSDITKMYAEKIVMPIFSAGLQGTLIGFFFNLEQHQKPHVRCALDQAGRQLADELALERKMGIQKLLIQNGLSAKTLADTIIQVASPVEQVIACSPEGYYGYVVCREENYLAGYELKQGEEAARLIEDPANEVIESPTLDPPFRIYLKTLKTSPSIDPVFHSLRVQTALLDIWPGRNVPAVIISSTEFDADAPALTREELDQVIAALEHQMTTEHGKRSVAKYLCFLEAVRRNYSTREVRLSNHEMQRRMSERLASSKINGYQVTGKALRKFELDIDRLLPGKIAFRELNGRVIHVSWNKDLF